MEMNFIKEFSIIEWVREITGTLNNIASSEDNAYGVIITIIPGVADDIEIKVTKKILNHVYTAFTSHNFTIEMCIDEVNEWAQKLINSIMEKK